MTRGKTVVGGDPEADAPIQTRTVPLALPGPPAPGVEIIRGGEALIRTEGDQMQKMALMKPRVEAAVLDSALIELRAYPKVATEAWYSIPFKQRKEDGSEGVSFVEGPSIRAALALARRWGNCSCRVILTDVSEDTAELEGRFLDLQTNFLVSRPIRVSRIQKRRGRFVEVDEREWSQLVAAAASKVLRNAILAGLPDGLTEEYVAEARKVAAPIEKKAMDRRAKVGTKESKRDQILATFSTYNLTEEDICKVLLDGRIKNLNDTTEDDLVSLRGALNALRDGVVKPDELRTTTETLTATEPVAIPKDDQH